MKYLFRIVYLPNHIIVHPKERQQVLTLQRGRVPSRPRQVGSTPDYPPGVNRSERADRAIVPLYANLRIIHDIHNTRHVFSVVSPLFRVPSNG